MSWDGFCGGEDGDSAVAGHDRNPGGTRCDEGCGKVFYKSIKIVD